MKREPKTPRTKWQKARAGVEGRDLSADLASLLNRYSQENGSNTPDFILAGYMLDCLRAFEKCSRAREKWFGKSLSIMPEVPHV